jgi:hypothetical protein
MKLNQVTAIELKSAGVDLGKLGETVNNACGKRKVTLERFSQTSAAFGRAENARIARAELTDVEDFALVIMAFDAAMSKVQKTWGLDQWALPEVIRESAPKLWPYAKPEPKSEIKPAVRASVPA